MTVKRKYVNRPLHSSLTTDELFCDTPATYYCECLARFGPSNCSHSRHPGIARAISRTGVISVPNLLVKTFGFLVPLVLSTCCYRVLARFVLKAMALCGNPPPAFCCVCWSAMWRRRGAPWLRSVTWRHIVTWHYRDTWSLCYTDTTWHYDVIVKRRLTFSVKFRGEMYPLKYDRKCCSVKRKTTSAIAPSSHLMHI